MIQPADLSHAELLRQWAINPNRREALADLSALTAWLIAEQGRGLRLEGANLAGFDLSDFDLRQASLHRAILHEAKLDRADLSGAVLLCPSAEKTSFRATNFSGAYMHAFSAQACDFSGAKLDGAVDLTGAIFHGCRLEEASLRDVMMNGTIFYQCQASRATFEGSDLETASFTECTLDEASFAGCSLELTSFKRCGMRATSLAQARGQSCSVLHATSADGLDLRRAVLPGLRLAGITAAGLFAAELAARSLDMTDCRFSSADFSRADLRGARFTECSLPGANFPQAGLANTSLSSVDLTEGSLADALAENLHAANCRFCMADLSGLKGRCAVFRDCNMAGAKLDRAYLYRAMLTGDPPSAANLRAASFNEAVLVQAYVCADLTGAALRNAQLGYARFNQSILNEADLRGSSFQFASFVKVALNMARIGPFDGTVFLNRCEGLQPRRTAGRHPRDASSRAGASEGNEKAASG
jgi:uncharacterized protein YjbI with pentapeptide repeats